MGGYLFAHFTGEHKNGEQIYFSLSRDGLHWHDLNGGEAALISGTGTCGVRDPFLVRSTRDGTVYLIATDLRMEAGITWEQAVHEGSRDLIVWETGDLLHWSAERACTVGIPEAGCVWAPEAVFDRERQEFFVFFASHVKKDGEKKGKHRIYGCYTRDFCHFSETFCYIEGPNDVIDTTILESGGSYYRITKDEEYARLTLEKGETLLGEFEPVDSLVLKNLAGVEGPEGYLLPDGKRWCVIADRFLEGKGYLPMVTEDLASGRFRILEPEEFDMGKTKKRHGGILSITDEEYERLYTGEIK